MQDRQGDRYASKKPPPTRSQAALAARAAVLDRLAWQMAELRASLDQCAVAHEAIAAELALAEWKLG